MIDKRVESMQIDVDEVVRLRRERDEILRLRREYEEAVRFVKGLMKRGNAYHRNLNTYFEWSQHELKLMREWKSYRDKAQTFLANRKEG